MLRIKSSASGVLCFDVLFSFPLCFQDVYDKLDYLSSLGKTQTAAVQRDADIGVAEAERDAGIRVRRLKALGTWSRRHSTTSIPLNPLPGSRM